MMNSLLCDESFSVTDDHNLVGVDGADVAPAPLDFGESISLLMSQENRGLYSTPLLLHLDAEFVHLRRTWVAWILQLHKLLGLDVCVATSAVSMLDRFVSSQDFTNHDMRLVAVACTWLAAKYKDSRALEFLQLQAVPEIQHDARSIQRMELTVLRSLGWSAITLTPHDFVAIVIHQLSSTRVFSPELVGCFLGRADELIAGLLPEAAFLRYQPSVISVCVLQCVLDECAPLQSAGLVDSLRRTLDVDMISAWDCYQLLIDCVVDPHFSNELLLPSPNHVADIFYSYSASPASSPLYFACNTSLHKPASVAH